MFFVDDLLLSPFKSLMWICRELQKAVDQEQVKDQDRLGDELSRLYMLLETQQITETEFEQSEREILDQMDAMQGVTDAEPDAEEENESDESDESDEPDEPDEPDAPDPTDEDDTERT